MQRALVPLSGHHYPMRASSWLDLNNDAIGVLGRALCICEGVIEVVMARRVEEQCQVAPKLGSKVM